MVEFEILLNNAKESDDECRDIMVFLRRHMPEIIPRLVSTYRTKNYFLWHIELKDKEEDD